jgi:hypothetical protein
MSERYISCPIYSSKDADFPLRVTERALQGFNILRWYIHMGVVHAEWNPGAETLIVREDQSYLPFVEAYKKIKRLPITYIKKEKELLRGWIIDYCDWPVIGHGAQVWPPEREPFSVASDPGMLQISKQRLGELHPELVARPPGFWKSFFGYGSRTGQGYCHDMLAWQLYSGDTRAALVMKTNPLIVACYISDFDAVQLLRFPQEFAEIAVERHQLKPGSRLVAVHMFWNPQDLASDLDTPLNPLTNSWRNAKSLVAEFLSDDSERIRTLHADIEEDEWQRCAHLAQQRMRENLPCRDGRPLLCDFAPDVKPKLKYPYGTMAPDDYEPYE